MRLSRKFTTSGSATQQAAWQRAKFDRNESVVSEIENVAVSGVSEIENVERDDVLGGGVVVILHGPGLT